MSTTSTRSTVTKLTAHREVTFQATILKFLMLIADTVMPLSQDKSNTGGLIARAFMWDKVQEYAKKQSDDAWDKLEEEEIIDEYKNLEEGEYHLGESPHFVVMVKVSKPRRERDDDKLAAELKKRYKVPEAITKDLIEKSKKDGSRNRTLSIVER